MLKEEGKFQSLIDDANQFDGWRHILPGISVEAFEWVMKENIFNKDNSDPLESDGMSETFEYH